MPNNILDVEDAYFAGLAQFEEWLGKFTIGFYGPQFIQAVSAMVEAQPEQVKEELRRRNPQAMSMLEKEV